MYFIVLNVKCSLHGMTFQGGFITTSEIEVTLTSNDDQVVYQCNGNNEALGLGAMDTISLKVVCKYVTVLIMLTNKIYDTLNIR